MACSRCGAPTFGPICAACKGEPLIQSFRRPRNHSILPPKRGQIEGPPPPGRRDVQRTYIVDDGGNDTIYEDMIKLKILLEEMSNRIGDLQPQPPIELMERCQNLATKLEMEVRRRRGL